MSDLNSDLSEGENENIDIRQRQQDEPSPSPSADGADITLESGTDTLGEYDIKSGLFVIIKQLEHKFVHDGHEWYKEPLLTYNKDWAMLSKLFGLTKGNSRNWLLGEDLHPQLSVEERREAASQTGSDAKTFEEFMDEVENRINKESDSITFVLVILMSHGFKDGSFLLSRKAESGKFQRSCDCPQMKRTDEEIQNGCKQIYDHSFKGCCNARKAYDHLIKPIQDMQKLSGKPKLFFVQTCRGNERCVVGVKAGPPRKSREPDQAIPIGSDTLVFYATIQDTYSWVIDGSQFLQAFSQVAENVKDSAKNEESIKELIDKLKKKKKFCRSIRQASIETYINAWMLDVCRDVSNLVSKDMILLKIEQSGLTYTAPYQKQQPEYQCSLRRRLSFLKLLRSTSL